MTPFAGYADGGTVLKNPSEYGGTWAWVWIDSKGDRIREEFGLVEPFDLDVKIVTNNVMELFAAVRLIESLPEGWEGVLYTDSSITLGRITGSNKFANVPRWLIEQTKKLRKNRKWSAKLLGGHPTKIDLQKGYKKRNGLPVSVHNVRCDELCHRAAMDYRMELEAM